MVVSTRHRNRIVACGSRCAAESNADTRGSAQIGRRLPSVEGIYLSRIILGGQRSRTIGTKFSVVHRHLYWSIHMNSTRGGVLTVVAVSYRHHIGSVLSRSIHRKSSSLSLCIIVPYITQRTRTGTHSVQRSLVLTRTCCNVGHSYRRQLIHHNVLAQYQLTAVVTLHRHGIHRRGGRGHRGSVRSVGLVCP